MSAAGRGNGFQVKGNYAGILCGARGSFGRVRQGQKNDRCSMIQLPNRARTTHVCQPGSTKNIKHCFLQASCTSPKPRTNLERHTFFFVAEVLQASHLRTPGQCSKSARVSRFLARQEQSCTEEGAINHRRQVVHARSVLRRYSPASLTVFPRWRNHHEVPHTMDIYQNLQLQ